MKTIIYISILFFIISCGQNGKKEGNPKNNLEKKILVMSKDMMKTNLGGNYLLFYKDNSFWSISVFTNQKNEIILGKFIDLPHIYQYYCYDIGKNELYEIPKPEKLGRFCFLSVDDNYYDEMYSKVKDLLDKDRDESLLDFVKIDNNQYIINLDINHYDENWQSYFGIYNGINIERIILYLGKEELKTSYEDDNSIYFDKYSDNIYFTGLIEKPNPPVEYMILKYNIKTKKTYKIMSSIKSSFSTVFRFPGTNIIAFIGEYGLTFYLDTVPED